MCSVYPASGRADLSKDRYVIGRLLFLKMTLLAISIEKPEGGRFFVIKAGRRDVLRAAYFGPEAGQMKGQNLAVSGAMDGKANEAKRIYLIPAVVL